MNNTVMEEPNQAHPLSRIRLALNEGHFSAAPSIPAWGDVEGIDVVGKRLRN